MYGHLGFGRSQVLTAEEPLFQICQNEELSLVFTNILENLFCEISRKNLRLLKLLKDTLTSLDKFYRNFKKWLWLSLKKEDLHIRY
jgi:hypothetical protein